MKSLWCGAWMWNKWGKRLGSLLTQLFTVEVKTLRWCLTLTETQDLDSRVLPSVQCPFLSHFQRDEEIDTLLNHCSLWCLSSVTAFIQRGMAESLWALYPEAQTIWATRNSFVGPVKKDWSFEKNTIRLGTKEFIYKSGPIRWVFDCL